MPLFRNVLGATNVPCEVVGQQSIQAVKNTMFGSMVVRDLGLVDPGDRLEPHVSYVLDHPGLLPCVIAPSLLSESLNCHAVTSKF